MQKSVQKTYRTVEGQEMMDERHGRRAERLRTGEEGQETRDEIRGQEMKDEHQGIWDQGREMRDKGREP